MNADLFAGDPFAGNLTDFMVNETAVKLLTPNSPKLPSKSAIAAHLEMPPNKLGLANRQVEDIYLQQLSDLEKGFVDALYLAAQAETLEAKVTNFLQEVINQILQKPQLAHLLSLNNLYRNQQINDQVFSLRTHLYLHLRRKLINLHIAHELLATTYSNLIVDLLYGMFLNISQNIDEPHSSLTSDLHAEIKVFSRCLRVAAANS